MASAEHLPQQEGDVEVIFSIGNLSKPVNPDSQHQNCVLQVLVPTRGLKITHRIKAEVKLVRISNNTHIESLDFFFLPPKITENQLGLMFSSQDHIGSLPDSPTHTINFPMKAAQILTAPESIYPDTIYLLELAVNIYDLSYTGMLSTRQHLGFDSSILSKMTEMDDSN